MQLTAENLLTEDTKEIQVIRCDDVIFSKRSVFVFLTVRTNKFAVSFGFIFSNVFKSVRF